MTAATAFADPNAARTQLRVAALGQWARAGMAMARTLAAESGRGLLDAARAFLRIAQAVRLAIALAMRLAHPDHPAFQPTPARARAARTAAPETAAAADSRENEPLENEPAEKPERDGREKFGDREVSDAAILRRPLAEIVKVICSALGVTPDWTLWADDDAPSASEVVPEPDRSRPVVVPPPDPLRAIPKPPPRQGLILDRPIRPPPAERLRNRLMRSCAPAALIPTCPPIACWRAVAPAWPVDPQGDREPSGAPLGAWASGPR
jgi:hypothetical protein